MKTATWIKINCFVAVFLAMTPLTVLCAPIRGDGRLSLYYDARKESLEVTFRNASGKPIPTALEKINTFLRSPDNQTHSINLDLLDLVDTIQDHFHEPVIELISGYRSPSYNRDLKDTGHAVANESLHMQGLAIDIHLDTATEEAVRDYALSLKQGGVGWYPQNDFVHVDLGPVRTWGHAETTRKWVGLNNNTGPLEIRSNANRYFSGDTVTVTITPWKNHVTWALERFDRGAWKTKKSADAKLSQGSFQIFAQTFDSLPTGRYRLKIGNSLSNEFYRKEKN